MQGSNHQHADVDKYEEIARHNCDRLQVTSDQSEALAAQHGAQFCETTPQTGEGVEEASRSMTRGVWLSVLIVVGKSVD